MASITKYGTEKYFLLKAEAFCAELLSNGALFDELVINFKGSFSKSYSNDIALVAQSKDRSEWTIVSINRDGIYDKMPEGLFHQTKGGSNTSTLGAMVGEYKRYREEERQVRKFFQPIEQELFRYAVVAEQKEQEIRSGILNGNMGSEVLKFWNIDHSLPAKPATALILIMPWIRQIKGDKKLTAKALSMMLEKPVSVVSKIVNEQTSNKPTFLLGSDAGLGIDTVCGSQLYEPIEQWIFYLQDIQPRQIFLFTEQELYGKFLKKFEDIFIPLEIEVKFDYQYTDKTNAAEQEQVLGYGYCL